MGKLKKTLKKISKMISRLIEFVLILKIIRQTIYHLVNFSKRNWKTILIVTMIVTGCVLLCLFFWFFGKISNHFFENETPQGELLKVFLTTIGGIVAIFALYYTAKRIKVMEKGNVETRFNNAVGHLGNANSAVILGGIHALHEIAVENKNYTKIVHNLFCSYLRENSAKLYENFDFEKTPDYCPVIIQILINYLFKPYNNKDSVYKNFESDLSFSTLINCNFNKFEIKNVIFSNYDFSGVEIKNVVFSNCILENCNFDNGTLTNCVFDNGTLTRCDFINGTLTRCIFGRGTLTDCKFWGGTLTNCFFNNAKLIDCYNIETAKLIYTELPPNKITKNKLKLKNLQNQKQKSK